MKKSYLEQKVPSSKKKKKKKRGCAAAHSFLFCLTWISNLYSIQLASVKKNNARLTWSSRRYWVLFPDRESATKSVVLLVFGVFWSANRATPGSTWEKGACLLTKTLISARKSASGPKSVMFLEMRTTNRTGFQRNHHIIPLWREEAKKTYGQFIYIQLVFIYLKAN